MQSLYAARVFSAPEALHPLDLPRKLDTCRCPLEGWAFLALLRAYLYLASQGAFGDAWSPGHPRSAFHPGIGFPPPIPGGLMPLYL